MGEVSIQSSLRSARLPPFVNYPRSPWVSEGPSLSLIVLGRQMGILFRTPLNQDGSLYSK